MAKTHITRTFAPIHFEDLDPHRFEDLVRELIYDFKDWKTIEATGRGGSDDGFDIRAYEKAIPQPSMDNEEDSELEKTMDGNLWMVQCKRERELGPTRIKKILEQTLDKNSPPYGYILVAPVNFSKQSFDMFRQELRAAGVMDFDLWGKAKLEDLLHLPRFDRVLFTFFGISLVSKRSSKTTEARSRVTLKNKLIRLFDGKMEGIQKPVLIRNIDDVHYPFKENDPAFSTRPSWLAGNAMQFSASGLWVNYGQHYAYIDREKKRWDMATLLDLLYIRNKFDDQEGSAQAKHLLRERVEDYWEYLPKKNQSKIVLWGHIQYDDLLLIDDKGDLVYEFPHLYVNFTHKGAAFSKTFHLLEIGHDRVHVEQDGYERIQLFPTDFPEKRKGKVYQNPAVPLTWEALHPMGVVHDQAYEWVDTENKYGFLSPGDIIRVQSGDKQSDLLPNYIRITHTYQTTVKSFLAEPNRQHRTQVMETKSGNKLGDTTRITVLEFRQAYEWEIDAEEGQLNLS